MLFPKSFRIKTFSKRVSALLYLLVTSNKFLLAHIAGLRVGVLGLAAFDSVQGAEFKLLD